MPKAWSEPKLSARNVVFSCTCHVD